MLSSKQNYPSNARSVWRHTVILLYWWKLTVDHPTTHPRGDPKQLFHFQEAVANQGSFLSHYELLALLMFLCWVTSPCSASSERIGSQPFQGLDFLQPQAGIFKLHSTKLQQHKLAAFVWSLLISVVAEAVS